MSSPHPQPASLARRSLDAVWHPCTQMARAEHLPPLAIARYAAVLLAQALPFMLILFVLFPRISAPLWGLPQDAHALRISSDQPPQPACISRRFKRIHPAPMLFNHRLISAVF